MNWIILVIFSRLCELRSKQQRQQLPVDSRSEKASSCARQKAINNLAACAVIDVTAARAGRSLMGANYLNFGPREEEEKEKEMEWNG